MQVSIFPTLKRNIKYLLALSGITIAAYFFSLNNAFLWDDEQFIYNNAYVKNFQIKKIFTENTIAGAGESSTYYRPLTTLSFATDHAIWGYNPLGFHLTNTLFHLLAGLLIFFYLRTLQFSKTASLVISSIFLIHPIQTEAVVYANSRGDSMYVFWAMVSLTSFALLLKKRIPTITIYDFSIKLKKEILIIFTVFGYLLAILGKEIGIATLGLIILTFLYVFIKNNNLIKIKELFKNKIAIITIFTSCIAALTYLFIRSRILAISTTQNNFFAGTTYGESLFVRLHTFTQAIWIYFKLLLFPYPLHMERTLPVLDQPFSIWLFATVLLFIFIIICSILELKKNNTVYIAFGSLWFFAMLIPVSGIIPINGFIYEHWLYMPIVGFCISIYGFIFTLIPKKYLDKFKYILKKFLAILFFIYIFLTIKQNYIWGDPIRFYTHTLNYSQSARLHNNLAMAYAENGQYTQAINQYNKAIMLGDFYPQTHHNLANTYLAINEIDKAKLEFMTALQMNANFFPSYIPLAKIFITQKDYDNAISLLAKLIDKSNDNPQFQNELQQVIKQLQNEMKQQ